MLDGDKRFVTVAFITFNLRSDTMRMLCDHSIYECSHSCFWVCCEYMTMHTAETNRDCFFVSLALFLIRYFKFCVALDDYKWKKKLIVSDIHGRSNWGFLHGIRTWQNTLLRGANKIERKWEWKRWVAKVKKNYSPLASFTPIRGLY